jgi:hypothetical protein
LINGRNYKKETIKKIYQPIDRKFGYPIPHREYEEEVERIIAWDNIHWWGAGKSVGKKTQSIHATAPGAFHALHIHWRWGEVLQTKDSDAMLEYEGEPQFVGESQGGVLTDPNIQNQTVKFAIVKNESLPKGPFSEHSTEDFESFFRSLNSDPKKIDTRPYGGDDLILYYSSEIFVENERGSTNELVGNIFSHGIFFAHQDEPYFLSNDGLLTAGFTGDEDELFRNPDYDIDSKTGYPKGEIEWKRNPKKD